MTIRCLSKTISKVECLYIKTNKCEWDICLGIYILTGL